MFLFWIDNKEEEDDPVPIVHLTDLNLRSGRPGGRFNLSKFDDNFEKVIGDIYDLDPSSIPKHQIIYTIMEPTHSNPNWTLKHGNIRVYDTYSFGIIPYSYESSITNGY